MLFGVIVTAPARYLDPGTGSYIFQLLIAVLVGVLFFLKVYWRKVKALAVRLFARGRKDGENN